MVQTWCVESSASPIVGAILYWAQLIRCGLGRPWDAGQGVEPESTVTVVTSFCYNFFRSYSYYCKFWPDFTKKNPKTPLRNRKYYPELLGGGFQDNLKIDIFQQNWTQKLSLWPKIQFCFTPLLSLHAYGAPNLSGCPYSLKLVSYKVIYYPFSLKIAIF